jgi:general secretion pathway protein G
MKRKRIQKRHITLIEIMIVMFLIALITGILAYNYQGSLEEGKVFKTKTGMEKLETIINLEVARDPQLIDSITERWQEIVKRSPIVKNPQDLIKDGWGQEYRVEKDSDGKIVVTSQAYEDYLRKKSEK